MKNYKVFTIIALVFMLALVVPTSAVWSNDNWIDAEHSEQYFGNAKVVTDSVTGVTSKYSNIAETNLMTYQGMVVGLLKSGQVLDGGSRFLIHRVGTPENETLVQYFQPDGKYTGYLSPGEYDVILPQGTGSAAGIYSDDWGYVGNLHEERVKINVVVGQVSYFSFIGNSVPTYRGNPKDATINAYFGGHDIDVKWMKIVKTGQHPHTFPSWDEVVVDAPAYDETIIDVPAHTEYRVKGHWDYHNEWDYYNGWHTHHYWDHSNSWSSWSDDAPDFYSEIPNNNKQTRDIAAVTHTIHHDAVTHIVSHPEITIQIPEYGIEFFIEIDGAHVDVTNPNNDPVNVDFKFDINYFIDKRPWDNKVDDGRIVQRTKTYTGRLLSVGSGASTYHGILHPDIDNAVTVADWNHLGLQYVPTITNDVVTGTVWA